jgi:hypothetical protein
MMDVESIVLADETPEVDAAEQRLAVAVEDESGLDTTTSTLLVIGRRCRTCGGASTADIDLR